jgi:hypothetical protein
MKTGKIIIAAALLAIAGWCCNINDKFEELRTNPGVPSPQQANIDLYLNQIQISFRDFWGNGRNTTYQPMTDFGAQLTRMEAMTSSKFYNNAYQPSEFNHVWDKAYIGVLNHVSALLPLAKKANLTTHIGIAEVLKAYTLMSLVDYFGDVPYSEAIQGSANTNPKADNGQDVYNAALASLDTAIKYLSITPVAAPANDLFYNGNAKSWITLAKTLKLRAYLQTRLVNLSDSKAKIDALLTENDLIDTDAEEFVFKYGTQLDNPESRHPKYMDNYRTNGALEFIGTYFMWLLTQEKGITDPRTRYYVYRQRTTSDGWSAQQLPCYLRQFPAHYPAWMPFCILPNGYWGRDHGNDEGGAQDNELRSVFGIYPFGGRFDNSDNVSVKPDDGAKGQGIHPIWLASFTDFAKAEAALTLGTAGNAKTFLESGIRKSIARVLAFPAQAGVTIPANRVPSQTTIDNYVARVLTTYDAATADGKLNVVMKEWYLALWGNGIDAYNNYRRTGKPDNMQLSVDANYGAFVRTFWYPSVSADLNSSVAQKANLTVRTFWDKNPDPLK